MNYYFLRKDLDKDIIYIDNYNSNITGIADLFFKGESLNNKFDYIHSFTDFSDGIFADIIDEDLFTVSKKLKDILVSHDENIEFFPVTVKDSKSDQEKEGFYAINILNTIEAIDKQKSIFEYDDDLDFIDSIEKFELDNNKVGSRNIFREKWLDSEIIVSEKLKKAIDGLDGLSFLPIENYEGDF